MTGSATIRLKYLHTQQKAIKLTFTFFLLVKKLPANATSIESLLFKGEEYE
jgi:hypothetical protein